MTPELNKEQGGMINIFGSRSGRRASNRSAVTWVKSSLSVYNGNCVEVAGLSTENIQVRDSKHPKGAVLSFTVAEWDAFIGGVHNGEFDRGPQHP